MDKTCAAQCKPQKIRTNFMRIKFIRHSVNGVSDCVKNWSIQEDYLQREFISSLPLSSPLPQFFCHMQIVLEQFVVDSPSSINLGCHHFSWVKSQIQLVIWCICLNPLSICILLINHCLPQRLSCGDERRPAIAPMRPPVHFMLCFDQFT